MSDDLLRPGSLLGLERQKLLRACSQVCITMELTLNTAGLQLQALQIWLRMHRRTEKKPRRIAALKGVNIVQAACVGWHCLAVSTSGQAYAWGGNEYGQCGVSQGKRDVPEPTPCLPGHKVLQVAAGGMHTCALTEEGQASTDPTLPNLCLHC